ncbi:YSIRK-type signal peptide-containing protein [Limosilactobacillus reuteri]|uniref:YSIRK-type signal peptide-containing protein n=1 Tax=Limosilactobacillus reuteri TaxID=1598 RepID=A0A517D5G3_LIMRT|nr:YSIRK-type signal peptide-containing protein [Limosilactobacillus reuteri]QDR72595.1 YSIRK-type signal peptide-containing protein [Limosilactobacillus reuteri]
MSKNNAQEVQKKMTPQRQRFGIRKLSVGVASVLLGTTFLVGGNVAHADSDVNSTDKSVEMTTSQQGVTQQDEKNEQAGTSDQSQNSTADASQAVTDTKNVSPNEQLAAQTASNLGTAQNKDSQGSSTTSIATSTSNSNLSANGVSADKDAQKETIFYGQLSDRSKNPASFNSDGIDPTTGKKYPVQLSDLEHDFIFKRTIVMHNADGTTSTFVEGLDGKTYDPKTDKKSGMYYRNATVAADGTVTYSEWKRLGNGGIYEFASDLEFPEYQLPTAMQDKDGNIVTVVPAAKAEDAENSTINLYRHKVTVNVTYKDANGKTVTNLVSEPFTQLPNNTYQYEGTSAALLQDKDNIAAGLLDLTSTTTGVFPQFSSLSIDGTNYTNQASAKSALAYALADYRNHTIQINVSYKYQLTINLYDESTGKLISVPSTDPSARYFTNEDGHSVYKFQVTPNTYVVNLAQLYNYTMTDTSLKTWQANFEKHSNGYWYTKTDMDKPLTLTLNYRSNGTYSFIGTMRDTDGNILPADYTKSLGNMYKNGAYQYATIKPGAYINDLTKFKLGDGYNYDYYLTADSLALWKEYFEQHSNGYWYAKDDLNTNIALKLTYDKVQKRNIKLTLVDADTGEAITNYAETTTENGRGFAAHMDGNVYTDNGVTKAGFAEFLLHMPGYQLTAASKAKLEAFLAQPYVEEDFTGTLEYQKLAPIHVVAKDSDGNVLFKYDITTKNAQAGNPYEVNVLNIPGYKLVKDENNNGEVSTTAPTVTFTYEKDPSSKKGTWIKDYQILTPGRMLPDHVGTIGVPDGKYNISFDDAEAENIKYYQEHGYTYLGAANAIKLGQTWYPLSWLKPTLVPNQGVTVHYYGIKADNNETQLHVDDYLAENPNNPDQTNHGINEDKFYYPEGSYTATPRHIDDWNLVGIRDSKGNFIPINLAKENGIVYGEYLPFAQDITYIYVQQATEYNITKTVKRTVHFLTENTHEVLKDPTNESVSFSQDYYTDKDNNVVTPKELTIGGHTYTVVDKVLEGQEAEDAKAWKVFDGNPDFVQVDVPEITDGKIAGDWIRVDASRDKGNGPAVSDNVVPADTITTDKLATAKDQEYTIYYIQKSTPEVETVTHVRHIRYYDGLTGDSLESIAPSVTQEVSFKRTGIYQNGMLIGYNTTGNKDKYGQLTVDTTDPDKAWVATTNDGKYVSVKSPDLTKNGYKLVPSFKLHEDNQDAATAPEEVASGLHDGKDIDIYYFHNTEDVQESADALHTIDYKYANGPYAGQTAAPDYKQTITYTRKGTKDLVTGKITWDGDWQASDTFKDVTSPEITDYTVDTPTVAAPTVNTSELTNGGHLEFHDHVLYVTNSQPTQPSEPSQPTTPTSPIQPSEPSQPTTPTSPTQPSEPSQPTTPAQPTDKTYHWTIEYIDEDGNKLISDVKNPISYKSGESFNGQTSGYNKSTITVNGKTYELVPAESSNTNGKFTDHDEVTIYVYKLKEDTPVTPDQPTTPDKPITPDQNTNSSQSVTPEKLGEPTTPVQPTQPGTPIETVTPTKQVTPVATPKQETTMPAQSAKSGQLPQTGNTDNQAASLGALGLLGTFLTGLGLGKKRRRN